MQNIFNKIKKILVKISYALFHKKAGRYILIAFLISFIGAVWILHSNIQSGDASNQAKRHVIAMQKDSASSDGKTKTSSDKKNSGLDKESDSDTNNTSSDNKKNESNKKEISSINGSMSSANKDSDNITENSSGGSTEKSSRSSGNNNPEEKSKESGRSASSKDIADDNANDRSNDNTTGRHTVTVTLTIDISRISGENSKKLINQDDRDRAASSGGTLLTTRLSMKDTDTVYDALVTSCQAAGIEMGARDTIYDMYVYEIDSFKEFDSGSSSGWMYSVNGTFPQRSCSDYKLSDGDRIVWTYVNDYTNMT